MVNQALTKVPKQSNGEWKAFLTNSSEATKLYFRKRRNRRGRRRRRRRKEKKGEGGGSPSPHTQKLDIKQIKKSKCKSKLN